VSRTTHTHSHTHEHTIGVLNKKSSLLPLFQTSPNNDDNDINLNDNISSGISNNNNNNGLTDRRSAFTKTAGIITAGIVSSGIVTSKASKLLTLLSSSTPSSSSSSTLTPAQSDNTHFYANAAQLELPLTTIIDKIENGLYFGPNIQRIKNKEASYPPNSNGAPEKHLPQIYIGEKNNDNNSNEIEISMNHVMKEEHYVQIIWLRDAETNEIVLAKRCTPNEERPFLKAVVPNGVTLVPALFCNLHGLWKGESFTV
jgi:desulfoferrodoxin (superoxide reductase-like protein)